MALKLIEKSEKLPISLELAKGYLRITHDQEDSVLQHLILAAIAWVEEASGKTLTQKTWTFSIRRSRAFLPNPPVLKILEVRYNGKELLEGKYEFFDRNGRPGIQVLFPVSEGVLFVRYITGYGEDPKDIPETLKNTILTTLAYLYENRGEEKNPKNESQKDPWIQYHRNYHL